MFPAMQWKRLTQRPLGTTVGRNRCVWLPDTCCRRILISGIEKFSLNLFPASATGWFNQATALTGQPLFGWLMRFVVKMMSPLGSFPLNPVIWNRLITFPVGTRMGSMFHHIFEHIDFQTVVDGPADILADDGARLVVESALALYRIEPRWAPQIARMVSAALRTSIHANDASLTLGRLSPSQRRHEMEFYFPLVEPLPTTIRVPGCTFSGDPCGEMVIRGFIDLVFLWQGRYYIADWKSNRLEEGYDPSAMAREMASAGYELQYQLYTIATLRWLKRQLGDRFEPHDHFGGAFYLFIRGMGGGNGQDGIFHVTPDQLLPLEALQETIQRQIAGLQW